MTAPFQLTPEQLQKQEDRKAAKLAKKAANLANRDVAKEEAEEAERSRFLKRPWIQVAEPAESSSKTVSIVSWNVCVSNGGDADVRCWLRRWSVSTDCIRLRLVLTHR